MKTAILTTIMAAMLAGIIFGATLGDREPAAGRITSCLQRESPAAVREMLAARYQQLELGARNAYWKGDYKLAAHYYHLMVKSGRGGCDDLYNLACCYGRMGQAKAAAKYLCGSVESGFDDTEHIRNDPDFQKIRNEPVFRKALDKVDRRISEKKRGGQGAELAMEAPKDGGRDISGPGGATATVSCDRAR